MGGHSGYDKTLNRLKRDFSWVGVKAEVKQLIKNCDICESVKTNQTKPSGLLQLLPIPS